MRPRIPNVVVENANIQFRNFSGRPDKYNTAGNRNFCVILDPDVATEMAAEGWNIKTLRGRDEEEPDRPYVQVAVSYKIRPPVIILITSKGRTEVDENLIDLLDTVDIEKVDLEINPHVWEFKDRNGTTNGVKAYLKQIYITLQENYLERKYAAIEAVPSVTLADYIDGEVVDVLELDNGRLAIEGR